MALPMLPSRQAFRSLLASALIVLTVCSPAWAGALSQQAGSASDPPDGRSSEADYVIRARVDDAVESELDDGAQKKLTGTLSLTWKNRSGESVSDLWFHLYLNAFANNRSLHLTEAKERLRGVSVKSGYGWQEVKSIRIGEVDITDSLTFRMPDASGPFDRTLFSVDLPSPVASGDDVTVEIEWESRLPRVRRRTGTKGNFIFLSHWFPKLAVYERERGWRAHPFHMNTEFYADFGTYDVTLDLAEEYSGKVAGSGQRVGEPEVANGRVVTRFVAPGPEDQEAVDPVALRGSGEGGSGRTTKVHGFAWTADPDYVVYEKMFRWNEWATRYEREVAEVQGALGLSTDELRGRDVLIRVMIHPEHEGQKERHWRATASTLFFYGLWYGGYPYAELTAVDPAWGGSAAGGMEYPTIFTCGTRMFTEPEMYSPESVTVHEAGHQFWYGLVGNNEPEAAWLDEGFNSFSDSETLFREYGLRRGASRYSRVSIFGVAPTPLPGGSALADGLALERFKLPNPLRFGLDKAGVDVGKKFRWLVPKTINVNPLKVEGPLAYWRDQPRLSFVEETSDLRWGDRAGYLRDPDSDPIETKVWDYVDSSSYRTNSYTRTAVALRSLQALVGRDAFLRGMREFSEKWRYRHPYPEDFYLAFQEGANASIQWYFDDVFRGTDTVDWVCSVGQTREPKAAGWFRCEDGSWTSECAPGEEGGGGAQASDGQASAESDPVDESADDEAEDDGRPWIHDVLVRRRGGLILPVKIRVTFEEGESRDFEWTREMQGEKRWWRLPILPGPKKIASVIIDPERLWFLDRNMSNNQWFAKPDKLAPLRWGERAMTRSSNVLQWIMAAGG